MKTAATLPSDLHFPAPTAGDVLAATDEHWDLTGPFPVARGGWLVCPVCRTGRVQTRHYRFHTRSGTPTVPHRVDVGFKCCGCACVWEHGVAVSRDWYQANKPRRSGKIPWRQAEQMLREATGGSR